MNQNGPVIVVDDDDAVRMVVSVALQDAGFRTVEADSGEHALQVMRKETPALVILDVRLPGLSGYEVCYEMRQKLRSGVPILMLSGERTQALDRVAGLLIGADDYLAKPFLVDELLVRVRGLIRRTPQTANLAAFGLTRRELDVLDLLGLALDQSEIGQRLGISVKTVGTHLEHIFRKLGVQSRAQAVAVAYRAELINGTHENSPEAVPGRPVLLELQGGVARSEKATRISQDS